MLVERAIHARDYTEDLAWQLVRWCHTQGAREFTLSFFGTAPRGDAAYDTLAAPLDHFRTGCAARECLTAAPGAPFVRDTDLWSLNPKSLEVIPTLFPLGPFEYPFGDQAWCEDLILYRDGELLLGIVSHEDRGLLRTTDLEMAQLGAAAFPTRDRDARIY